MSTLNPSQARALQLVVKAVLDAVKEMGPQGAPAGPLYAALMSQGCTLNQFQSLMGALERAGKVRRDGDLYFATE